MRYGRIGERYILGGRNMTFQEILRVLGSIANLPPPTLRVPYKIALWTGAIDSWVGQFTGRPPRVPLEGVKMARYKMYVNSAKAERELGYHPGPVESALERAVRWFRENGYVPA
jgi:dihydroflavonol-4-reductase